MNKHCLKHKKWLKKGNLISLVCFESNLYHISHNTWWIDSSSTIHILNTMQSFRSQRKLMESERFIYLGNWKHSHMEAIRTYGLVLCSGFVLDFDRTFYIPSFIRTLFQFLNFYSWFFFSFNFFDTTFQLFKDSVVIGDSILDDGPFRLHLNSTFDYNLIDCAW